MQEKMRYVTARENSDGSRRYYWQRPGCKFRRLPDNDVERYALVKALNEAADQGQEVAPERGTLKWVCDKYRASDEYRELAPGTVKYYKRYLREIEALGPSLPFTMFTRSEVIDFLDLYPKAHQRRQCAAVLKNLFNLARYHGVVEKSEMDDLRLKASKPRTRIWTDEEIESWLREAAVEDPHMVTAFQLLRYTAQRPSDVLLMTRSLYDGDTIKLRQEKTKTLIAVPCHSDLQAHLDALPKTMMLVTFKGSGVKYGRFNVRFRRVCLRAGIDAQARDLRRTAMVNMALAGATVPQIASVSGHSIEDTQKIIDTYIPRNVALARQAIAMLPTRPKV